MTRIDGIETGQAVEILHHTLEMVRDAEYLRGRIAARTQLMGADDGKNAVNTVVGEMTMNLRVWKPWKPKRNRNILLLRGEGESGRPLDPRNPQGRELSNYCKGAVDIEDPLQLFDIVDLVPHNEWLTDDEGTQTFDVERARRVAATFIPVHPYLILVGTLARNAFGIQEQVPHCTLITQDMVPHCPLGDSMLYSIPDLGAGWWAIDQNVEIFHSLLQSIGV